MANRFQKFIYYLSAEAPILFVLAIVWWIQKKNWIAGKTAIAFFADMTFLKHRRHRQQLLSRQRPALNLPGLRFMTDRVIARKDTMCRILPWASVQPAALHW